MNYNENSDNFSIPAATEEKRPKRKFGADVILLIFICLFALLALSTVTFLKFGVDSVLTGEDAIAAETQYDGTITQAFMLDSRNSGYVSVIEDGVVTEYETTDPRAFEYIEDDLFVRAFPYNISIDYDKDTGILSMDYYDHYDDGTLRLDSHGEPIILHFSEYQAPGSISFLKVDLDEKFGLDGTETTDNEIAEKIANASYDIDSSFVAYAADGEIKINQNTYPYNSYRALGSASAGNSNTGGNGNGCDTSAKCVCTITGGVFLRWYNNNSNNVQWSVSGSATPSGSNNSRITGTSCTPSGSTGKSAYYQANAHSDSTGSCSGSNISVSVSATFSVKHLYNSVISISGPSINDGNASGWVQSRASGKISATATSSVSHLYEFSLETSNNTSGGSLTKNSSSGIYAASKTLSTNAVCKSIIKATAKDMAEATASATFTATQLKIDTAAPVGTDSMYLTDHTNVPTSSYLQKGSSTKAAAKKVSSASTTLYIWICVKDTDSTTYTGKSDIKSVTATNSKSSAGTVTLTKSHQYSSGSPYYWYRGSVSAKNANGCWSFTITDNANNSNTAWCSGTWISCVDCAAPTYNGDFAVDETVTKQSAQVGSYWSVKAASGWSSAPLFCKMTFSDKSGWVPSSTSYYSQIFNVNGIKRAVVTFSYRGTTYTHNYNGSSNNYVGLAQVNKNNSSAVKQQDSDAKPTYAGTISSDTDEMWATVYFVLPSSTVTGLSVTVYDNAGASCSTGTISSSNYTTTKVDVVAPKVFGIKVDSGSAANKYANKDITLTVSAKDFNAEGPDSSYYPNSSTANKLSIEDVGNGSGLYGIYVYAKDTTANSPSAIAYVDAAGKSNCSTAFTPSVGQANKDITVKFTINKDNLNLLGKYSSLASTDITTLYVVAVDYAGNKSDTYNGRAYNSQPANGSYKSLRIGDSANSLNKNAFAYSKKANSSSTGSTGVAVSADSAYQWANYYRSPRGYAKGTNCIDVYRDSYKPEIYVYKSYNSSTGALSDQIASLSSYNSSGVPQNVLNYTFEWENISQQTFYVQVKAGNSGGTLRYQRTGDATPINVTPTINNYLSSSANYTASGNSAYMTSQVYTISINKEGRSINKISFLNGATYTYKENNEDVAPYLTITTQIDRTPPQITLKGFTSQQWTSNTASNTIEYTEAQIGSSSASWIKSACYAVFMITDSYSGIELSGQKYGVSNNMQTQATAVDYTLEFEYSYTDSNSKTHVYKYEWHRPKQGSTWGTNTPEFTRISGTYYVQIPMFRLNDMQGLDNKGNSGSRKFYNASDSSYDVALNTYLQYRFKAKDFIGNEKTYETTNSKASSNGAATSALKYTVDPFPITATVTMSTVTDGNWKVTNNAPDFAAISPKMTAYYGLDWTKDYVVIKVQHSTGLTPVTCDLLWKTSSAPSSTPFSLDYASIGVVSHGNKRTNNETWFCLAPDIQKEIKVQIKCSNLATNTAQKENIFVPQEMVSQYPNGISINVKQDKSAPNLKAVFFSENNNITSPDDANIALYFDWKETMALLQSKPSDWSSSYSKYYAYNSTKRAFEKNTNSTWTANKYYESQNAFVLNTQRSKKYTAGTNTLWLNGLTYLYVVASDYNDSVQMNGSGIYFTNGQPGYSSVKAQYYTVSYANDDDTSGTLSNSSSTLSAIGAVDGGNYQYLYRTSNPWYGYTGQQDNYKCWITICDYVGNETLIGTTANGVKSGYMGGTSTTNIAADNPVNSGGALTPSIAFKMFPVVDAANPNIKLVNTSNVTYKPSSLERSYSGSYTFEYNGKVKLRGTEWDNSGNAKKYDSGELSGQVIKYITSETNITINMQIVCGISGYTVYIRERALNQKLADYADSLAPDAYGTLPDNYDLSDWKYYSSKNSSQFLNTRRPGKQNISVQLSGVSISNRFDVLIVLGNGKYYLYEMGDVIVDNAPPVFYSGMTFFTQADSDTNGGTLNYNNLKSSIIWSDIVGSSDMYGFTNGKVNAYFFIEDAGIGIGKIKTSADIASYGFGSLNGDTSASLIDQDMVYIGSTVLEKVTVTNVPVIYLGTKSTHIVCGPYIKSYTAAKVNDTTRSVTITYEMNGKTETRTFNVSATSNTLSIKNETLTFYRYTASSTADISPRSADGLSSGPNNTNHVLSNASVYSPKIDLSDVSTVMNMFYYTASKGETPAVTEANKKAYNGLNEDTGERTYSRSRVDVVLQMTYGVSGIGNLTLKRTDLGSSAVTNYSVNLPKIYCNSSKKYVLQFATPSSTFTYTTNITYSADTTLTLTWTKKNSKYYWKLNNAIIEQEGSNFNETTYAAAIAFNMTIEVAYKTSGKSTTSLLFSIPGADYQGRFDYIFNNGVSIKSSKARENGANGFDGYPALTSGSGYKYVFIDVTAPQIDVNSGTYKALANATSWNAVAKLLSVAITDNFEMGRDSHNEINDVVMYYSYYEDGIWKTGQAYMINNFELAKSQASDNLYRPTDATWNGTGYAITKFIYCEYNKPYRVVAYDKAGNRSEVSFTPKIDNSSASITELKYYTRINSVWIDYVPGKWTSDIVKIVGKASYGTSLSGYVLQARLSSKDSFSNGDWVTLTPGTGYTVTANTGRTDDGYVEFTIVLAEDVTAYYNFYELRVLTGAQYNEFYNNGATTDNDGEGVYLQLTRTTFTDSNGDAGAPQKHGSRYLIGDVTYRDNSLQGAVEVAALAAPGRTNDSSKKGVRIDKVTPVIGGDARSSGSAYGSLSGNTWTCGAYYVNNNVVITITATQTANVAGLNYASGNIIYYTSDLSASINEYSKWTALLPKGTKGVMATYANGSYSNESAMSTNFGITPTKQTVTEEYYISSLTYTLNNSQRQTGFKFFIVSGAGLSSAVFTVADIKIDMNKPTVGVQAVDTYQEFFRNANAPFSLTNAQAFGNVAYQIGAYQPVVNGNWTKKNSVILKVDIGNIGYSGAKLMLKEELMLESSYVDQRGGFIEYYDLSYDEFVANKGAGGLYVVYIAIGENGNRRMTVNVVENAYENGDPTNHRDAKDDNNKYLETYVRIDNTTPFVSVASIDSAVEGIDPKADNWDYAASGDKWYTDNLAIVLKAGMIEKSGGIYTYKPSMPYSGYTVYVNRASYLDNKDGRTIYDDSWQEIDVSTYSGLNATYLLTGLINNGKYRFMIKSGTGMEYVIGEGLKDNTPNGTAIANINYNGNVYVANSLQRAIGIGGHNIDGERNDALSFDFNIDTNRYSYTYKARLLTAWKENEAERQYNNNTGDLVEYVVRKGDWSNENGGVFTEVSPDKEFKHGDVIRVSYTSKNYSVEGFADSFAYYHNFTEIKNAKDTSRVGPTTTIENDNVSMYEGQGTFKVVFAQYDVTMVADYGAELPVTYGPTSFFMQYNNKPTVTTGSVSYAWRNNAVTLRTAPSLNYKYYVLELDSGNNKVYTGTTPQSIGTVNGNSNYFDVGAYYVVPSIPLYDAIEGVTPGAAITGQNVYVYDADRNAYVRPTETSYQSNKTYYRRNETGNFRVAVLGGGAEERQEFVVKYFSEDTTVEIVRNNPGFYTINDLADFKYIDKEYYSYDEGTNVVTKCSYLRDTNNKVYKLLIDLTLTPTTFSGFEGSFAAEFNGNGKTITLSFNNNNVGRSYGIFNDFAGTLYDLNIVSSDVVSVYLTGSGETDIGLLAKTISGGLLYDVSVTADFNVRQSPDRTATTYIGGIAAKAANVTVGAEKAVYTDIRVKNNGQTLRNINIGGMFGLVDDVNFDYAVAFGDLTVYNAENAYVGIVAAKGTVGRNEGLYYFSNNTFLNDATVNTIGTDFNASFGKGKPYDDFIATTPGGSVAVALGAVNVGGTLVRNRILDRLYADFGFDTETGYQNGLGTTDNPLQVATIAHLTEIDEYVNLSYKLTSNIQLMGENGAASYQPIAIHKVFNGTLDGATGTDSSYYVLSGFGGDIETYTDRYFGFFGQLNGTVKNIVFNKFNVKFTYTGTEALHAGIVAGRAGSGAKINNVIVIGLTTVTSLTGPAYVGGVLGSAMGSDLYDIGNMNNISVTASTIKAGGIVGKAGDGSMAVVLARTVGRIYSFGRVETMALGSGTAMVDAGAILGEGTLKSLVISPSVYGLLDNTYILGVVASDKSIGNGTSDGSMPSMVKFTNATMRQTSFSNGKSPFTLLFGQNNGWYPLDGEGLASNPFKVTSEADFHNINLALYAYYQITRDINFTAFETIGDGLNFTGTIDGTGEAGIGAEESNIVTLTNVTKPLVYNVMGTLQNLGINVNYNYTVKTDETLYYGAVAVYLMEGGNIKNITIDGNVNITGVDNSTTAYVSGFAAVVSGGTIDNSLISDNSKLRNNISALNVNITGVGTVYAGGYAASVQRGGATFSFGIANGSFTIEDCGDVVVGFLVGQSYGECSWNMALSSDYFYNIDIITHENGVRIVTTLEKPDDDDEEDRKNLIGREN